MMVNGLNERWKIPIAYFFINSLSGTERSNLVKTAVHKLNETKIVVTNLLVITQLSFGP